MKKIIFVVLIVLFSCSQVEDVPPENLIGEEKMADLIFELAVLNSSKGFLPKDQKNRIDLDADSFYQFHEIDSLQFTISNAYYAKQPKSYLRIVNRAKTKLEEFKKNMENSENKIIKIDSKEIKTKQIKNINK